MKKQRNILLLFILVLSLNPFQIKAKDNSAIDGPSKSTMNEKSKLVEKVIKNIQSNPQAYTSVYTILDNFSSLFSGFRDNPHWGGDTHSDGVISLVYSSRSLQDSSFLYPRIIRSNGYGSMIAYSSEPADVQKLRHHTHKGSVEVIVNNIEQNKFDFYDIQPHPSGALVNVNPTRCLQCHGLNPRPIFDAYFSWPGVYGNSDPGTADKLQIAQLLTNLKTFPNPLVPAIPSDDFAFVSGKLSNQNTYLTKELFYTTAAHYVSNFKSNIKLTPFKYALLEVLKCSLSSELQTQLGELEDQDVGRMCFSLFPEKIRSYLAKKVRMNVMANLYQTYYPITETLEFLHFTLPDSARESESNYPRQHSRKNAISKEIYDHKLSINEAALSRRKPGEFLAKSLSLFSVFPNFFFEAAKEIAKLAGVELETPAIDLFRQQMGAPSGGVHTSAVASYARVELEDGLEELSVKNQQKMIAEAIDGNLNLSVVPNYEVPRAQRGQAVAERICSRCHFENSLHQIPFHAKMELSSYLKSNPSSVDDIEKRLQLPAADKHRMPKNTYISEDDKNALLTYIKSLK